MVVSKEARLGRRIQDHTISFCVTDTKTLSMRITFANRCHEFLWNGYMACYLDNHDDILVVNSRKPSQTAYFISL